MILVRTTLLIPGAGVQFLPEACKWPSAYVSRGSQLWASLGEFEGFLASIQHAPLELCGAFNRTN